MKKLLLAALAVTCLPLSACVSQAALDLNAEYQADYLRTRQTCDNPGECKAMWEAAQVWVAKNAAFKIQTQTDLIIETYNSPFKDSGLAVRVMREPLGDGTYLLTITADCGMSYNKDCDVHPGAAVVDFNATMKATKEAYRKRGAATL